MSEELAYARKASGLVRGLSMMDAFAVGFMNQGLTPSIWVIITLGLGVFLGGNLIWACIFSAVLAGIGFPLVWGILGGSMPRSGGEYVYNSRIIHPVYGIAQSFGDAAIWLMWLYVLAPLAVNPGLTSTFNYLGWTGWRQLGLLAQLAHLPDRLDLQCRRLHVRRLRHQDLRPGAEDRHVLRHRRLRPDGLWCSRSPHGLPSPRTGTQRRRPARLTAHYHGFIAQVSAQAGQVMPTHTNWGNTLGTMVAMSWLFAYAYSIAFIAGEVKRPDKSIIWANTFAILVPFVFMMWIGLALYRTVGFQFLNATAWLAAYNGNTLASMAGMPHRLEPHGPGRLTP